MLLPSVGFKCRKGGTRFASSFVGGVPAERLMNATAIVIEAVSPQLSLQIKRIPKEDAIEILSAQGTNEPFDQWMRRGNMGNGLDFVNFKYA